MCKEDEFLVFPQHQSGCALINMHQAPADILRGSRYFDLVPFPAFTQKIKSLLFHCKTSLFGAANFPFGSPNFADCAAASSSVLNPRNRIRFVHGEINISLGRHENEIMR